MVECWDLGILGSWCRNYTSTLCQHFADTVWTFLVVFAGFGIDERWDVGKLQYFNTFGIGDRRLKLMLSIGCRKWHR